VTAFGPGPGAVTSGRFEFRVGDEVPSIVDGEAQTGSIDEPDVIVEGDPEALYYMFVDRRLDLVKVSSSSSTPRRLLSRFRSVRSEQRPTR
jgi:hypothetical protein